jgi:hypothetical protein
MLGVEVEQARGMTTRSKVFIAFGIDAATASVRLGINPV